MFLQKYLKGYFPTARRSPKVETSQRASNYYQLKQEPVRGVTNHPTEVTNLLKSSRETLFEIKLVIEPSSLLNDQAEIQKIFAIVKNINILLSTRQINLVRNTRFRLQVGAVPLIQQ